MTVTITKSIKNMLEEAFNEFVRLSAIDDGKVALDDDMPDLCGFYAEDWEDKTGMSADPFFDGVYPSELVIDDSLSDVLDEYVRGWRELIER